MFLGNAKNDGHDKIITASGIFKQNPEEDKTLSQLLAEYLCEPEHRNKIADYPTKVDRAGDGSPIIHKASEKTKIISLQLPEGYIRAPQQQVYIGNAVMEEGVEYKVLELNGQYIKEGSGLKAFQSITTVEEMNKVQIEAIGGIKLSYWEKDFKLLDEALTNSIGYFHRGMPTYGGYSQYPTVYTWYSTTPSSVLDWLIGYITYILRIEIVGWTGIVENWLSNGVNIGTEDMDEVNKANEDTNFLEAIGVITTNKVTVEDVIFNNVPLLDINFFNAETAAGKELSTNSIIYKIRNLIAQWYYTLRVAAIIIMIAILIYNAIKSAFSTMAEGRASAKKVLIDWLIGFIIVFGIHYYMIGIIFINNQVIDVLKPIVKAKTTTELQVNATIGPAPSWVPTPAATVAPTAQPQTSATTNQQSTETKVEENKNSTIEKLTSITQNNEESFYEQVRIQAYEPKATTGWGATLMYMALVVYVFMFVVMYLKRVFILILLTVMSPIVGVLYAFNKRKYGISTWSKEYMGNVLTQLVHALAYTALMVVAFEFAKSSTFVGSFIAVILMGLLFTLENIVKKMFGYGSKSLGELSSAAPGMLGVAVGSAKTVGKNVAYAARTTGSGVSKAASMVANSKIGAATKDYIANSWVGSGARMVGNGMNTVGTAMSALTEMATDKVNNWIDGDTASDGGENGTREGNINLVAGPEGEATVKPRGKKTYADYYKRAQRRRYAPSSELADKIKRTKAELKEARKEFSNQAGFRWMARTLIGGIAGTATLIASVPVMAVNSGIGLGMSKMGYDLLKSGRTRRDIEGYSKEPRKLRGKKMIFYALPAGTTRAALKMMDTVDEGIAIGKKYDEFYAEIMSGKMAELEKARQAEIDITERLQEIYESFNVVEDENEAAENGTVSGRTQNNFNRNENTYENVESETAVGSTNRSETAARSTNRSETAAGSTNRSETVNEKLNIFRENINRIDREDLERALNGEIVDEHTVFKAFSGYYTGYSYNGKINMKWTKNAYEDMQNIEKKLSEGLPEGIELTDKFSQNLRDEIRKDAGLDQMVERTVKSRDGSIVVDSEGNEVKEKVSRLDVKDIEKAFKNFAKVAKAQYNIDISKREVADVMRSVKKSKAFNELMAKQDLESINKLIQKKIQDKAKTEEMRENLRKKMQTQLDYSVDRKTQREEKKVEEHFNNMNAHKAIKLFHKTLNQKDSLKVDTNKYRFGKLLQDVNKLKEANGQYGDIAGERIYDDVNNLVLKIRDRVVEAKTLT